MAHIQGFFDPDTFTVTHVVADPATKRAAIVDSVLDFDPKSGRTSTASADAVIDYVRAQGLTVDWLLETHAHADHLSAAPYLKEKLGGQIAIGADIQTVQAVFKTIFNAQDIFPDGRDFDVLFADGDEFHIGELAVKVLHTPGHTPACVTYLLSSGDAFVGDTIFMPDYGTARCDFPGGDAAVLFASIQKLLSLPPETRLHLCHDYPPPEREATWITTVAEQRAKNIHVHDGIDAAAFIKMRSERDQTLAMPRLLLPSVQVNVRAGRFPDAEDDGVHYLKIPLNRL